MSYKSVVASDSGCVLPTGAAVHVCRQELAADLAELEEKVDNISVSNPRVAQEYRYVCPQRPLCGCLSAASSAAGQLSQPVWADGSCCQQQGMVRPHALNAAWCPAPPPPPPSRVRKDQIEAKARDLAALQSQLDADTQELDLLKVSRAVSGGQGNLGAGG